MSPYVSPTRTHLTEKGKYKIRYPGWESRWDEWVPRSRLRWAVERNRCVRPSHNIDTRISSCWCEVAAAPVDEIPYILRAQTLVSFQFHMHVTHI